MINKILSDAKSKQNEIKNTLHTRYLALTKIIEYSFTCMEQFVEIESDKNDHTASVFKELISRYRQTAKAIILLSLSGFEIEAKRMTRELLEIEYLVLYLFINPLKIKEWSESDNKTIKRKFSPFIIRKEIGKILKNFKETSDADYAGHSMLSHVTPHSISEERGIRDLSPNRKKVRITMSDLAFHISSFAKIISEIGFVVLPEKKFEENIKTINKLCRILPFFKMIDMVVLANSIKKGKI